MDYPQHRPNVGVVLFHPDGRVWLGRRAATPGPHNWQFPQGGVDAGEDLYAAALRELEEETGVTSVSLLGRTEGWIVYDFPPDVLIEQKIARNWKGQKQAWFALRFTGEEAEIRLEEAADLVIPFKRAAYEQVIKAFRPFAAARP